MDTQTDLDPPDSLWKTKFLECPDPKLNPEKTTPLSILPCTHALNIGGWCEASRPRLSPLALAWLQYPHIVIR